MRVNHSILAAALLGAATITVSGFATTYARAAINPFTETFASGPVDWRDLGSTVDAQWFASGALDGTAYISATVDVDTTPTQFDPAVLRAQANFGTNGSSNGAFVGNWLTQGVTTLSFDVRHDAPIALKPFFRLASPSNFPGAAVIGLPVVQPNTWTHVDVSLDPSMTTIALEGFPLNDVLASVGNLQFGMQVASIRGQAVTMRMDIDNVAITPAPGAAVLFGVIGLAGAARRRLR